MRKIMLLTLFALLSGYLFAQQRVITGKVTDASGKPLAGASVTAKGSSTGVTTGEDGSFRLPVTADTKTLVVSSVGYASQELSIGNQTSFSITLQATTENLDEVVVVGYGTQANRRVSSSIARLDANTVRTFPVASPIQALQGQVAGVNVTSGSSRPGSPIGVNIRGRNSINAGNSPLYVVDGVILNNNTTTLPTLLSAGQGIDQLAVLNPEDIESYEVLKDAAAAAIYGSRGSNGVVLITTKKGSKAGKSTVGFSSYYGYQSLTKRIDLLNASEYRQLYNEARTNMGLTPLFTQAQIDAPPANVNWVDEVLRSNSIIQNYQLNIQSGNDRKTQFYTSLGYLKQEGPLLQGDFTRVSGRLNLEHSVSDKLKIGTNMSLARTLRNETPVDNSIYSPFPRANIARPDQPIYNTDGTFAVNDFNNPVHMFQAQNYVNISNVLNSTYAELRLAPGLKFRSSVGVDYTILDQRTFNPITSLSGAGSNGSGSSGYVNTQNYILTQNLNYSGNFVNNNLHLDATAVYEFQKNIQENNRVDGTDFPSDATSYLTSAARITGGTASWTSFSIASMIGRVNLDWKNKYLLGASVRRDGSSKIPANGRFGIFPAVSLAWNAHKESFLMDAKTLSTLKFRASYGLTGNQDGIGNFASRRLIGTGYNYYDQPGFALAAIGSPNLKWETTEQIDLGVDLGLWNDRVKLTADIYRKKTRDLLLNRPIPSTVGFTTILENIGNIEGSGLDLSISTVNISNKDLRWTTTLNASFYKNKVTNLYNNQPINGSFVTQTMVGQPLGSFFLIKSLGVNPATGDMQYEDINKDNVINSLDRQFLGGPLPSVQGGLTNTVTYKGFDLSVFFQYALGQKVYNLNASGLGGYESLGANVSSVAAATNIFRDAYVGRWTSTNTTAAYPRAIGGVQGTTNTQNSSRYLQDAGYGRLKNLTLGYSLPRSVFQKAGISSLRFYVSMQNMFTITKYRGYDPEISSDFTVANYGVDQTALPQMKTVSVGLQVQF